MKITLLGSGDPLGMPVPLCGCRYCEEGPERLRAGLKVESDEKTLVFDIGPDLRQQLIETGTQEVDAFFATHAHFDHFGAIPELNNLKTFSEESFEVFGSEALKEYFEENYGWTELEFQVFEGRKEFGDLEVQAFPVEHSENFPMHGFSIEENGRKAVYIPDLKSLPESQKYRDADILFVDGMYLFEKHFPEDEDHAAEEELEKEIDEVGADKVVLLGISEHFNQMSLEEEMDATEHEIGLDLQEYRI